MSKLYVNNLRANQEVSCYGRNGIIVYTTYYNNTCRIRYYDNQHEEQVDVSLIRPRISYLKQEWIGLLTLLLMIISIFLQILS